MTGGHFLVLVEFCLELLSLITVSSHSPNWKLFNKNSPLNKKQQMRVHPTMSAVILSLPGHILPDVCTLRESLQLWRNLNHSYYSEVSTRLSVMLEHS